MIERESTKGRLSVKCKEVDIEHVGGHFTVLGATINN